MDYFFYVIFALIFVLVPINVLLEIRRGGRSRVIGEIPLTNTGLRTRYARVTAFSGRIRARYEIRLKESFVNDKISADLLDEEIAELIDLLDSAKDSPIEDESLGTLRLKDTGGIKTQVIVGKTDGRVRIHVKHKAIFAFSGDESSLPGAFDQKQVEELKRMLSEARTAFKRPVGR